MNLNEILIVIVLLVLLIFVIIQVINSRVNEPFNQDQDQSNDNYLKEHSDETCNNYPFLKDECSEEYLNLAGDIHVQYNEEAIPKHSNGDNIHFVYPNNPCCLRTCINDFTYTKENTLNNSTDFSKIGTYKEHIDKNLYFASKCNMCLDNFYVSLKRLSSNKHCDVVETKTYNNSGCDKQI
jgi:hypothetical protein